MTLLNTAKAVYAGSTAAQAVYLGADKIWPSAPVDRPMPPVMDGLMIFLDGDAAVVGGDGYVTAWPDKSGRNDHPRLTKLAGNGLRNDRATPTGKKVIYDPWVQVNGSKATIVDWDHQISTSAGHLFFVLGKQVGVQSCFHAIGTGDDSYWINWNVADGYPVVDNFGSSGREMSPMGVLPGVDPATEFFVGQTWTSATRRGFKVNDTSLYSGPAVGVGWSTRPSFFEAKNWAPGLKSECAAIVWYNRVLTEAEQQAVYDWMQWRYIKGGTPPPLPPSPPPPSPPKVVQNAGGSTSGGTVTRTLPAPTVAGNTLLWVASSTILSSTVNATIASISDSAGNVWTKLRSVPKLQISSRAYFIDIWACFDSKPITEATATLVDSGNASIDSGAALVEISGETNLDGPIQYKDKNYMATYPESTVSALDNVGSGLMIAVVSSAGTGYLTNISPAPWIEVHRSKLTAAAVRVVTPEEAGSSIGGAGWQISVSRHSVNTNIGPLA